MEYLGDLPNCLQYCSENERKDFVYDAGKSQHHKHYKIKNYMLVPYMFTSADSLLKGGYILTIYNHIKSI